MKNNSKKSTGFYLTIASTVLAVVGLCLYAGSPFGKPITYVLVGVAAALGLIAALLSAAKPVKALNVLAPIASVVMAAGLTLSFASQIEPLGFAMSGLYTFAEVANFIYFVPCVAIAWILTLVVSFTGYIKK